MNFIVIDVFINKTKKQHNYPKNRIEKNAKTNDPRR